MDINLGPNKGKQKLALYKEDDPKEIAINFAATHGLDEKKVPMLEKMLR